MVIERTLKRIDSLKERPHHERRAFAALIALGVIGVLLLGWSFFLVRTFTSGAAPQTADETSELEEEAYGMVRIDQEAAAAAAASGYLETEDGYQLVPEQQQ